MKLHMQEKKKKKQNRDIDLHTQGCTVNFSFFGATLFRHRGLKALRGILPGDLSRHVGVCLVFHWRGVPSQCRWPPQS